MLVMDSPTIEMGTALLVRSRRRALNIVRPGETEEAGRMTANTLRPGRWLGSFTSEGASAILMTKRTLQAR